MAIKCNSIGEAVMAMDKTFKMQGENDRDDASELLEYLQQLARTHGMVEVVLNNDGTFDVRAGGVSCYSKNMRAALRARAQNEIDRVTARMTKQDVSTEEMNRIAAAGAQAYSGAISGSGISGPGSAMNYAAGINPNKLKKLGP
jgi:hypothetical protein